MAKAPTQTTARVLVDFTLDEVRYRADDVLTLPADLAESHAAALDPHPDAVAYAIGAGSPQKTHGT